MSAGPSSTTCAISAAKPLASKKRSDALARSDGADAAIARVESRFAASAACVLCAVLSWRVASSSSARRPATRCRPRSSIRTIPSSSQSGVPAYLLLVDGLISQSPDSVGLLVGGRAAVRAVRLAVRAAGARRDVDGESAPLWRTRDLSCARRPRANGTASATTRFVAELAGVDEKNIDAALRVRRQLAQQPRCDQRRLERRRRAAVGRSRARARARARRDLRARRHARLSRDPQLVAPAGARRQARRRARAFRARHRALRRPGPFDQGRIRAPLRASRVRSRAARSAADGSAERAGRRAAVYAVQRVGQAGSARLCSRPRRSTSDGAEQSSTSFARDDRQHVLGAAAGGRRRAGARRRHQDRNRRARRLALDAADACRRRADQHAHRPAA